MYENVDEGFDRRSFLVVDERGKASEKKIFVANILAPKFKYM